MQWLARDAAPQWKEQWSEWKERSTQQQSQRQQVPSWLERDGPLPVGRLSQEYAVTPPPASQRPRGSRRCPPVSIEEGLVVRECSTWRRACVVQAFCAQPGHFCVAFEDGEEAFRPIAAFESCDGGPLSAPPRASMQAY